MTLIQSKAISFREHLGRFRPSSRALALAFFGGATVHALLAQIPPATLSDMAAPKNGLALLVLLGLGLVLMTPWFGLASRRAKGPPRFVSTGTGFVPGPLWLIAFVCLVYSHPLIWLFALAVGAFASLHIQLSMGLNERSSVLGRLGFAVVADTARTRPGQGSWNAPAAQVTIAAVLVMALLGQLYPTLFSALTIPHSMYVLPLYIVGIGLALVAGQHLRTALPPSGP